MRGGETLEAIRERESMLGRKSGAGFYTYDGAGTKGINPEAKRLVREAARKKNGSHQTDADIVRHPMFAMVNEAARALDEGIVDSAERLDLALVLGIGFAPFRGGICRYADDVGLGEVRDTLNRYADRFGERFRPAPMLKRLADEGATFHDRA